MKLSQKLLSMDFRWFFLFIIAGCGDDTRPALPNVFDADTDAEGSSDDVDELEPNGDIDIDGILNNIDNCPWTKNSDQPDRDQNGIGDACDSVGLFQPTFELVTYLPEESYGGVTIFSVRGGLDTYDNEDYANFGFLTVIPMTTVGSTGNQIIPLWLYSDFTGGYFNQVELLPEGAIIAIRGQFGGDSLAQIDPKNGDTDWIYNDVMVNHDYCFLPDGNLMFIYTELKEHANLGKELRLDSIRVIDKNREPIWNWSLYERDPDAPVSEAHIFFSNWWSNCNAISFTIDPDWSPSEPLTGDIYLNCRLLNRLYKIHYPSGDIEWVMGTDGDFGDGFFYHAHDPQISFVEDAEGNRTATRILMYDNHESQPLGTSEPCPLDETCPMDIKPYSRLVEIEIDNELNAKIIWKWPSPTSPDFEQVRFYSPLTGGIQELQNGNLLITNGTQGGDPYLGNTNIHGRLIELKRTGTPTGGKIIWDVNFEMAYGTFKALRISENTVQDWDSRVIW